jgi:hypothetical protein
MIGRRAATPLKLRLHLRDETFLDVWLNPNGTNFSWGFRVERRVPRAKPPSRKKCR